MGPGTGREPLVGPGSPSCSFSEERQLAKGAHRLIQGAVILAVAAVARYRAQSR